MSKENRRAPSLARKAKRPEGLSAAVRTPEFLPAEHVRAGGFTCLVLLPFDSSARPLRDTIQRIIYEEQGNPIFLDQIIAPGARWVDEVSRLIQRIDAVIADVTRSNPNVMFELGMAHGLGKPLVLLLNEVESAKLPTDLLGYQYLTYAPDDLSEFSARLGKRIRQLGGRRGTV